MRQQRGRQNGDARSAAHGKMVGRFEKVDARSQQDEPGVQKQKISEVFFGEKLFVLFHLGLSLIL